MKEQIQKEKHSLFQTWDSDLTEKVWLMPTGWWGNSLGWPEPELVPSGWAEVGRQGNMGCNWPVGNTPLGCRRHKAEKPTSRVPVRLTENLRHRCYRNSVEGVPLDVHHLCHWLPQQNLKKTKNLESHQYRKWCLASFTCCSALPQLRLGSHGAQIVPRHNETGCLITHWSYVGKITWEIPWFSIPYEIVSKKASGTQTLNQGDKLQDAWWNLEILLPSHNGKNF